MRLTPWMLGLMMAAGCAPEGSGQTCEPTNGDAPCCDIPAPESIVCDDGEPPDYQEVPGSRLWTCAIRQPWGGAYLDLLDEPTPDGITATWGQSRAEFFACGESGRLRFHALSDEDKPGARVCYIGKWDADGRRGFGPDDVDCATE